MKVGIVIFVREGCSWKVEVVVLMETKKRSPSCGDAELRLMW